MDELLIPIESEGDRRSPTAKVDLWEPVSRDEFVHLLRDFKLGEEGPRDQLGHWDWSKQQGKKRDKYMGTITETLGFHMIVRLQGAAS